MLLDMIFSTSRRWDPVELASPGERVVEPLGVGVVRAEADAVGADEVDQARHRVLPERVDPHVAVEHLERVLGELVGHLLVGELQVLQQQPDPAAAVLDAQQPHAGEAGEHAVADGRGERVLDGAPAVGHRGEGLRAEGHVLGTLAAFPGVQVVLVAAVGGVQGDEHAGLLHPRPERVELGQEGRAGAAQPADGGGPHQHGPGTALDHPLELGDALVDHARVDDGRREDAALVVVAPLLVEPLVEGADGDLCQDRVVDEPLLDEARQRREHERGGDALLVEQRQPGAGLTEGGDAGHRLAGQLAQRASLRVVAGVEGHVRAGPGDDLERGVGDELGEPVAHDELLAAAQLDEPDEAAMRRR